MIGGPVLQIRRVRRVFEAGRRGQLVALRDVSLEVAPGEVLAIVGESGCGKTTLARIMLGLAAPTSGEVLLDGAPVSSMDRLARARRMQPVFQDPYSSLNPRHTVGQILALPLELHNLVPGHARATHVAAMLERVGLGPHLAQRYPAELSGGQRQRVAIARALMVQPGVLVCDEPTSALDVTVQGQILGLLAGLVRDLGLTMVFISHDLAVVRRIADRIAVMYLGDVVELAGNEQLFSQPGHPYTKLLLACVPTPEPGRGLPPIARDARPPDPFLPPPGCSFHPRCPSAVVACQHGPPPPAVPQGEGYATCHLLGGAASA